jgi:hypothetical protein
MGWLVARAAAGDEGDPVRINDRAALVTEAVDGLVRASGGRLARLDGDPAIRVVAHPPSPGRIRAAGPERLCRIRRAER